MQVNTNTNGATNTPSAAAKSPTVDYQAFLKLMIAQMKNQDPTNPTDGTQFLSQLASFSSVEQAIQTNTRLDSLITSSLLTQADTVIGRTIVSEDGSISGKVASVKITDGALVATLEGGKTVKITSGVTVQA